MAPRIDSQARHYFSCVRAMRQRALIVDIALTVEKGRRFCHAIFFHRQKQFPRSSGVDRRQPPGENPGIRVRAPSATARLGGASSQQLIEETAMANAVKPI